MSDYWEELEKMEEERDAQEYAEAMAYRQGREDELDKIYKMIFLGCGEVNCEECDYSIYSQDVCQQAYTFEMIEKYIAEQLKE